MLDLDKKGLSERSTFDYDLTKQYNPTAYDIRTGFMEVNGLKYDKSGE